MKTLKLREKSILAGLFLSKFDSVGLDALGFQSFTEAFNVIGYALGVKPRSLKNYRDEFDPLFPNPRKGWHNRPTRSYCKEIYDTYFNLELANFTTLIKNIIYRDYDLELLKEQVAVTIDDNESTFAKRLITGQAAEQYFLEKYKEVDEFQHNKVHDTTRLGCGFDFKLVSDTRLDYFGVEVKGLNEKYGNVALTSKEYTVAQILKERYFLFVVKNFKEDPFHCIYRNPIETLDFSKSEQRVIQISWKVTI